MPVHATVDDVIDYMGVSVPVEIPTRLIREASDVVAQAVLCARYATDEDGAPTDTTVQDTLRDATCAQARPAVEALVAAACDDGKTKGKPMPMAPTRLTPEASRILQLAGMLPARPWVVG